MKEHIETNNGKNTDLLFHFLKEEFACSEKNFLKIIQVDEDIDLERIE